MRSNKDDKALVKVSQDLKKEFKKPSPLPASKAPTGRGSTKNDLFVQRLAVEFQHDPVAELVKIAQSTRISPDLKAKINLELLSYYLPKLKAIDTNPNQGEVINLNVVLPSQAPDVGKIITIK